MKFEFKPSGVCSTKYIFDIEDNHIKSLIVENGCSGNLQGISNIVKDMDIDKVIDAFDGIKCGFKNTSCPDQIAKALKTYKENI